MQEEGSAEFENPSDRSEKQPEDDLRCQSVAASLMSFGMLPHYSQKDVSADRSNTSLHTLSASGPIIISRRLYRNFKGPHRPTGHVSKPKLGAFKRSAVGTFKSSISSTQHGHSTSWIQASSCSFLSTYSPHVGWLCVLRVLQISLLPGDPLDSGVAPGTRLSLRRLDEPPCLTVCCRHPSKPQNGTP